MLLIWVADEFVKVCLQVFLAVLAREFDWECDPDEPWITAENYRSKAVCSEQATLQHNNMHITTTCHETSSIMAVQHAVLRRANMCLTAAWLYALQQLSAYLKPACALLLTLSNAEWYLSWPRINNCIRFCKHLLGQSTLSIASVKAWSYILHAFIEGS